MSRDIDPGDAVPPGVAVQTPTPLTDQDRRTLRKLESMGADERDGPVSGSSESVSSELSEHTPGDDPLSAVAQTDHAVELETQTVRPHSDAQSRADITGSRSGADSM